MGYGAWGFVAEWVWGAGLNPNVMGRWRWHGEVGTEQGWMEREEEEEEEVFPPVS